MSILSKLTKNITLLLILIFSINLSSCVSPLEKQIQEAIISDIERDAVQTVLNFYDGEIMRSKGFSTENGVTETYFEIDISKSELIEDYATMVDIPASNIAYLFYSSLKEEKEKYTHIKVIINLKNGNSKEFYYSDKELVEIDSFIPMLNTISRNLIKKDYNELVLNYDSIAVPGLNSKDIKNYCEPYDSLYGDVIGMQFQGFNFHEGKNNRELVYLAGANMRTKDNIAMSILMDRKSKKLLNLKFGF